MDELFPRIKELVDKFNTDPELFWKATPEEKSVYGLYNQFKRMYSQIEELEIKIYGNSYV